MGMTIRQKQHLLGYLGYYTCNVDGLWGNRSRQAAKDFQKDNGFREDGNIGEEEQKRILKIIASEEAVHQESSFWEGIQYFERSEFRCTCGGRGCNGFPAEPARQLVKNADTVRKHFGSPAIVSSGVRCQKRNAELPGSAVNSLHLKGKAMDFAVVGVTAAAVLAFVRTLPCVDEAYAIDTCYVHMGVEKN